MVALRYAIVLSALVVTTSFSKTLRFCSTQLFGEASEEYVTHRDVIPAHVPKADLYVPERECRKVIGVNVTACDDDEPPRLEMLVFNLLSVTRPGRLQHNAIIEMDILCQTFNNNIVNN